MVDTKMLEQFNEMVSEGIDSFKRMGEFFLLHRKDGTRCICNSSFEISAWFDSHYEQVFHLFILHNKDGTRCICTKDKMRCSKFFTGSFRLGKDRNVIFWDKPEEKIFVS